MNEAIRWTRGVALGALILASGCSDSPEFDYTGEDMQRAIVGTWTGYATPSTGSGNQLPSKLDIAYSSPGSRPACENRVLGGLQPQCIDSSEIGVTGTLTTEGLGLWSFVGQYTVMSLHLSPGDLHLSSTNESYMTGRLQNDGTLKLEFVSRTPGHESAYTLSLSRGTP